MRIRQFPESNYKAVFSEDGVTLHMRCNVSKPYCELQYPELYDIAINNVCKGGCQYCYISATHKGHNYTDICEKAMQYFGQMNMNQRPFQVAIGGAGEPTLHPDFCQFLKVIHDLGIMPNYTTNGMHLDTDILEATKLFAGGVAVTCHNHLTKFWKRVIELLAPITRLNLHIIPMSLSDVDRFVEIFQTYKEQVEYFVLLPYQAIGFGKPIDMKPVYNYLFDEILSRFSAKGLEKIAYGAYFYDQLKTRPWIKADLYEHGLFSKYLDMDGDMTLYKSSYEWQNPLKTNLLGEE